MFYRTRCEYANHYKTDAITSKKYNVVISKEMPAAYGMLGNKAGSW